jgi:superfamily II DNA/RNA helicase
VAAIHGDRSQAQREKALAAFQNRRVQALVATDVAARGIHVDGIDCVVHFDPPDGDKTYMHRSGRTGRAGATGTVVSFVDPADMAVLRAMQRQLGFPPGASEPDLRELTGGDMVAPLRIKPASGTTLVATPPKTAVDHHQPRRPRAPWRRSEGRRGTKR